MALEIARLNTRDAGFRATFERLLDRSQSTEASVEATVRDIVADVRQRGDAALMEYTRRFDQRDVAAIEDLEVPRGRLNEARLSIPAEARLALETAASRIRTYHARH